MPFKILNEVEAPSHLARSREWENKIADKNLQKEHGALYNKQGKLVAAHEGGAHGVDFTTSELDSARQGTLIHNHPSGHSFSHNDLALAHSHHLTIRAVGTDGEGTVHTYQVKARHPSKSLAEKITREFPHEEQQAKLDLLSHKKGLSDEQVIRLSREATVDRVCKENDMTYTHTVKPKEVKEIKDFISEFNPDEARNEKGEWTDEGALITFKPYETEKIKKAYLKAGGDPDPNKYLQWRDTHRVVDANGNTKGYRLPESVQSGSMPSVQPIVSKTPETLSKPDVNTSEKYSNVIDPNHYKADTTSSNLSKEHIKNLSDEEKNTIKRYSGGYYSDINSELRKNKGNFDKLSPDIKNDVENIDAAINKNSIDKPTEVYRGMLRLPKGMKEGEVYTEHGYMSTTTDPQVALGYAAKTVVRIHLEKGDKFLGIERTALYSNEHEVLGERGTQLKIVKISKGIIDNEHQSKVNIVDAVVYRPGKVKEFKKVVLYDLPSDSWIVCEMLDIDENRSVASIQDWGGYYKTLDLAVEYAQISELGVLPDTKYIQCKWNGFTQEFVNTPKGVFLPVMEGLETDEQRKWWFAHLAMGEAGGISPKYLEKLNTKTGYKGKSTYGSKAPKQEYDENTKFLGGRAKEWLQGAKDYRSDYGVNPLHKENMDLVNQGDPNANHLLARKFIMNQPELMRPAAIEALKNDPSLKMTSEEVALANRFKAGEIPEDPKEAIAMKDAVEKYNTWEKAAAMKVEGDLWKEGVRQRFEFKPQYEEWSKSNSYRESHSDPTNDSKQHWINVMQGENYDKQQAIDYAKKSPYLLAPHQQEVLNEHPELNYTNDESKAIQKWRSGYDPQNKEEFNTMKSAVDKYNQRNQLTAERVVEKAETTGKEVRANREAADLVRQTKTKELEDVKTKIKEQGSYKDIIQKHQEEVSDIEKQYQEHKPLSLSKAETNQIQATKDFNAADEKLTKSREAYLAVGLGHPEFDTLKKNYYDSQYELNRASDARVLANKALNEEKAQAFSDIIRGDNPKTNNALDTRSPSIKNDPARRQTVNDAKDWLSNSLNGDRFNKILSEETNVKAIRGRAFEDLDGKTVNIAKNDSAGVIVHEMGHVIEGRDPVIHQRCIEFLESRADSLNTRTLKSLTGIKGYRNDEVAYKGNFPNPYVGKVYGSGNSKYYATEVLSMGLQYMHDDPIAFKKKDSEYFNFIVLIMKGKM